MTNADLDQVELRIRPTALHRWLPLGLALGAVIFCVIAGLNTLWMSVVVVAVVAGARRAFFASLRVDDDGIKVQKLFGTTEVHAWDLQAVVCDESSILTIFGWEWEPHVLRSYRHGPEVCENFAAEANALLSEGNFVSPTPDVIDLAVHLGHKRDRRVRQLTVKRVLPALALGLGTLFATWWIRDNLIPTSVGPLVFQVLSLSLVLLHLPWLHLLRSAINELQRKTHWHRYADELDAAILQRNGRETRSAKAA